MQRMFYTIFTLVLGAVFIISMVIYDHVTYVQPTIVPEINKVNIEPATLQKHKKYDWVKEWKEMDLSKIVQRYNERWLEATEAIRFSVKMEEEPDYIGVYHHQRSWELKGENHGKAFILKKKDDHVLLEFDKKNETFPSEEFNFLIPTTHFSILFDLLQQQKYDTMEWNKVEKSWHIRIYTHSDRLTSVFQHYLFDHFKEEKMVEKFPLAGYTLTYDLQLEKSEVQSLQVILEKRGNVLEKLTFSF